MKEKKDGSSIKIEERLPDFSLDPNSISELEKILVNHGFGFELTAASFGDIEISGSFDEILEEFKNVTSVVKLPSMYAKQKDEGPYHCVWFYPYSDRIEVTTTFDQKEKHLAMLRELLGFFEIQNKNLKPDEESHYLYLRPKQSIEYIRKKKTVEPDNARILINTIEAKLRKLIREIPSREKDIQDAIENILVVRDYEYHREIEHIPTGSKSTVPDFTLDSLGIALEVKFCNKSVNERQILEEINADITAYQSKYQRLIFIVYDLGIIRDVDRFGADIRRQEDVHLSVVKH